jgi:hypothetical protein
MDARKIIDFAADGNAKEFREGLYASIYDKVNAHIEQMKQSVAQNLVTTQEEKECVDKDDAKKIAKKEVGKHEDEMHEDISEYTLEEIDEFMQTEEFEQLDELEKKTLRSYRSKAATDRKYNKQNLADIDFYKKSGGLSAASKTKQKNVSKAEKEYQQKSDKRSAGIAAASKRLAKEEFELDESVSRKHFQQVADLIKSHDNHDKRKELAQHHATIFAMQNPRFDRSKFMKAANVQE